VATFSASPLSRIGAVHGLDTATRSSIRSISEAMFVDGVSGALWSSRYFLWLLAWGSTS
jgi:hypothetical protein